MVAVRGTGVSVRSGSVVACISFLESVFWYYEFWWIGSGAALLELSDNELRWVCAEVD